MEQGQHLTDTNAVIAYLGKRLPATKTDFMNAVPNVSGVPKIEVLGFDTPDEPYRLLTDFMDDASVLDLTDQIVEACTAI